MDQCQNTQSNVMNTVNTEESMSESKMMKSIVNIMCNKT